MAAWPYRSDVLGSGLEEWKKNLSRSGPTWRKLVLSDDNPQRRARIHTKYSSEHEIQGWAWSRKTRQPEMQCRFTSVSASTNRPRLAFTYKIAEKGCWRCLLRGRSGVRPQPRRNCKGHEKVEEGEGRQWDHEAELGQHSHLFPCVAATCPHVRLGQRAKVEGRESRCARLLEQAGRASGYHRGGAVSSLSTQNGAPNPEL